MTKISKFIHLRVHSAYSLSNGAIKIKDLLSLCNKFKMPAVAITDVNNIFGAMEFSELAKESGTQPIIGCQISINYDFERNKLDSIKSPNISSAPMVFLVKNKTGYKNLLKLLSYAYLKNKQSTSPEIPFEILKEYANGLIALTGGPHGPLGCFILNEQTDRATSFLNILKSIFKENLYMEIMRHGESQESLTETSFLDLAYQSNIPLIATNEAYFPDRTLYDAHDALICIDQKAYVSQKDRNHKTPEHYFKSSKEMETLFADLPEAIENTIVIAQRCSFLIESRPPILPPFDCGPGKTEKDELKNQADKGLKNRLNMIFEEKSVLEEEKKGYSKPYQERLRFELNVINQMGFPGYFLIVADIINWSKKNNIPVGPGRGSGAGSLVAWSLNITELDPIRWGLLFERFLNPERVTMPDFDIDFCQDLRDKVIQYVQKKYGREKVAQIITFGKLQSRAVLRDVGRVLEMPYRYIDKICKLIQNDPAKPMNLSEAISAEPILKKILKDDPDAQKLMNIAKPLEGLYRHASTHAAGMVIGDRPLEELIPLYRDPKSDIAVTGFNMKFVEAAGLVKFDFLGLKTLTVLSTTIKLIRQRGDSINLEKIPLNNQTTFGMMGRGETTGVFQLESSGMRDVLKNLKPDTFEDIIAVVALYRPGPMSNIPSYIKRKHGKETISYLHPTLEGILKETYGIMIYQEQVMQIAQTLSGYSLGKADLLRRAMGKKIKEEMDEQRQVFIDGAEVNGVSAQQAEEIFKHVNKFAGYGFNKSHAAAYALIAYQTAYLKANYPLEFFAASMTLDLGNTDKLNIFRQELSRLKISLLPPNINKSTATFNVEACSDNPNQQHSIRYALSALRNVGQTAMQLIVNERGEHGLYNNLSDFFNRINPSILSKRQLESLIKAGAFDTLNTNRRQIFLQIDNLIKHLSLTQKERNSGQIGLFNNEQVSSSTLNISHADDWSPIERLKEEFDAIGFYLSGHPLNEYKKILNDLSITESADINNSRQSGPVKLAGTILSKKEQISAKGNRYAFIKFSDMSGSFEVTTFSDVLEKARDFLYEGKSVIIDAMAQFEDEQSDAKFLVQKFSLLDDTMEDQVISVIIYINTDVSLKPIHEILLREKAGSGCIKISPQQPGYEKLILRLKKRYKISPAIIRAIRALPGVLKIQEI